MATSEVFRREHSNMKQEEVIQNLIELFGNVLDWEIIRSVALNCNCNMERTSNILLEMSSSIGAVPKKPKDGKRKKQINTKPGISNAIAATLSHDNDNSADVIIESERVINYLPSTMNSPYVISSPKTSAAPQAQRKSKKEQEFDRIVLHVRQGSRILIFLRGLPGSGKSYLAKEIVDKAVGLSEYQTFILSTDDYFINKRTGIYEYDRTKLQEAHEWNQQRAYRSMAGGISPVIIDNTNSQMWEMKSYAMMATNYGYRIEIVEPFTYWAFNDKELARRNRHGVPKTKIKEMFERYEKNITPTKLLAMYGLSYNAHFKPPVNRNYPPIPHNSMNYNKLNDATVNSVRIKRITNGVSNAIVADYGQDENLQFNSNERKTETFSNIQNSIDLMDFEDVASQSVPHVPNIEEMKSDEQNVNSVDSILMHSPTNTAVILEPSIWGSYNKRDLTTSINSEPEMKKIRTHSVHIIPCSLKESVEEEGPSEKLESASTSTNTGAVDIGTTKNAMEINKLRNIYPDLNLSSWGLPENAMSSWRSWDIVSPLNCATEHKNYYFEERANSQSSVPVETLESSTNTSSSDFALLDDEYSALNHFKMLETTSRDITEGIIVSPPMSPPKKTLLDKSSMTNEDVLCAALSRERTTNDEKQIRELRMLFPNIPLDYLMDVYEKCKKDLNWAVDLLLDDNKEISESLTIGDSTNKSKDGSLEKETVIVKEENNDSDNSALLQATMEELSININKPDVNLNDEKSKSLSKEVIELKKHLEDNVEINKDCYSQHILKIKSLRRGISNDSSSSQQTDQPSTSKTSNFEAYFTSKGEVIAVNSDEELYDFEPDIDFPQSEESEEEMVELNLGSTCVSQLEAKFGFPDVFPQGFLPVVQVPAWLAGQLHAFYVESVLGQMETQNQVLDMIVKEDEEFAKKLQMQEEASSMVEDRKTPDLQRIMEDEQLASNLYKKQTEEWQQLTPDNLAAKLTRQKLFTAFPTVEETLLTEILHAHGNSYEQTIEVLLASTEQDKIVDPDGTIREPPITEAVINEMKKAEEETKTSTNVPDVPKSATEYREEASAYLKKHKELIQKAHQAYQKKQFPVAQFYSDLAKTYTQLYDQANGLAAMAFLDEHSKKLQSYHTLDLHYLYVKEAIEALDIFIDNNIQLLQGSNKRCENLFIITGRGKRSDQGKSRLKPAVMARLRKRNIWYCEMNPGLLKVRVRADSKLTSNVH